MYIWTCTFTEFFINTFEFILCLKTNSMQAGTQQMTTTLSDMEAEMRSEDIVRDVRISELGPYHNNPLNLFLRCHYATIAGLPDDGPSSDKVGGKQPRNGMLVAIVRTHKLLKLNMAESMVDVQEVTKDGQVFGGEFTVPGDMLRAYGMPHEHLVISLFLNYGLRRSADFPKHCHFFPETMQLERIHFEMKSMEQIVAMHELPLPMQTALPQSVSIIIDLQTRSSHVHRVSSKYLSMVEVGIDMSDELRAMFFHDLSPFITARAVG